MAFPNTVQVPIQFSGGLNSKISDFTLDQPYLQKLENGVYNLTGQIDKRAGFICLSNNIQGGGTINSGSAITTFNDELLLLDGTNLYSYNDQDSTWIDRGIIFATTNDQTRILNIKTATQANPDATSSNNISMYIWEDTRTTTTVAPTSIRYSIINNNTNTLIISDQVLYPSGTRPKVINDGYNFYAIFNASDNTILYDIISVDRPYLISSEDYICQNGISTTSNASIPYDAVIFPGIGPLVAYAGTSGIQFNIADSPIIWDGYNIQAISICVDSNYLVWVNFSDNDNTYVSAWRYTSLGFEEVITAQIINSFVTEPAVNIASIAGIAAGSINLTTEIAQSNGVPNYIHNYVISIIDGYASCIYMGEQRGVGLASKPFLYNNNIFITTIYSSNLQSTYFTQCLTQPTEYTTDVYGSIFNQTVAASFAVIAKHNPQNGGNYRNNGILSQADPTAAEEFLFAGQRKGPFTSWNNAQTVNLGVAGYSIEFNQTNAFNSVSANNNLHIVGGVKKIYDGVSCVEDNFHLFPETKDGYGCDITLVSGGNLTYNVLTQPNFYQYCVVYEWTDNFGQVQRSGPSVANGITTTATGQGASLVGPMLPLTDKLGIRSPVIISIYRTQDSLPIFYKITDDNNPLINDVTQDTWTFLDLQSDQEIGANEDLYTGSQLGNTAPPSCSLISLYQQRLMINSTEDTGVLWFSQNKFEQDQYNTLPLDWNTSFVEGIDSRFGNDITAIGLLDNSLAIFKKTSIFLLQGDGPNALDTSGQFNDAFLLVSDTGCLVQNSLVFITQTPTLPGGLLFKSPKGIYLLGRDQSITYIGAPVEQYNDLTITSANLLTESNQVVFGTLEGICLVYNYYFNAWSTWTNLPSVNGCVWQDNLILLQDNGAVMVQDNTGTIFSDSNLSVIEPVKLLIQTPWIKASGGMQNYQSIYNCMLLGINQENHILNIQVAYDYNSSIISSALVNANIADNRWGGLPIWGNSGVWGDSTLFGNYQYQININKPRCQSIQFTFSDVNNTELTQGFSLCGLVLECMTYQGGMRLPVSNKVGVK